MCAFVSDVCVWSVVKAEFFTSECVSVCLDMEEEWLDTRLSIVSVWIV